MSFFIRLHGEGEGSQDCGGVRGVAVCDSSWCRHSRHLLPVFISARDSRSQGGGIGGANPGTGTGQTDGRGEGRPGPPVWLLDTLLGCLIYARVIVGLNVFAQCPSWWQGGDATGQPSSRRHYVMTPKRNIRHFQGCRSISDQVSKICTRCILLKLLNLS